MASWPLSSVMTRAAFLEVVVMRSKLLSSTSAKSVSRPNFDAVRLHIEYVATAGVLPVGRRLRTHGKAQIQRLAASIDRHGFNVPLLVDDECAVVSGQARLDAALLLGLDQVPVIRIVHLTEEQLRLFAIFDNKIGEESGWDDKALNLEFEELRLTEPELNLTDSGFAIGEIDAIAGRARTAALNDLDDATDPDPERVPVTRLGDIWLCGRHRIICGDATDADVIASLVDGREIRQLLTDPPYNVAARAISSTGRHSDFAMAAGEMSAPVFTGFLTGFLVAAQPTLANGALVYAFMDHAHLGELLAAGVAAGLTYKQLLVWVKAAAGMGSFYRSGHELIAVFKHGDGQHRNNLMLGRYGRNRSNVLQYPGVMRMATSTGGTLTGKGGDLIIIDDPLKADDAYSETARDSLYEWATQTLFTRLDDKTMGSIILVQQRQHEDDLSGHMLRTGEWLHISLPAIAVEEERFILSTAPLRVHTRRVGDLLDPVREPIEVLQALKRQMGTAAFEAQYQQAPMPPDGDVIKLSWFRTYDELPGEGETVFSVDTASKAGLRNDWSVIGVWRIAGERCYLEYLWRRRVEYPELKRSLIDLAGQYRPNRILIEDKGSGIGLIQDLKAEDFPAKAYEPGSLDKESRMRIQSAKIEAGRVLLPVEAPWLEEFQNEVRRFPNGAHDDQIDALSQLLDYAFAPKDIFISSTYRT